MTAVVLPGDQGAEETRPAPPRSHPALQSKESRAAVRESLMRALGTPHVPAGWDPAQGGLLLGIVAGDVRIGIRALRDWCQALGLEFAQPEASPAPPGARPPPAPPGPAGPASQAAGGGSLPPRGWPPPPGR